jgi:hypothetical protein
MKADRRGRRKKAIIADFRECSSSARTKFKLMSVDTKKLQVSQRPPSQRAYPFRLNKERISDAALS